jgi:phosphoribosylformylglycinamidine cyclo-ligase
VSLESGKYKEAGVDIDMGLEIVERIKDLCRSTFSRSVISDIGTFGAGFDLKETFKNFHHPILVQSIDGVGTKLKIAAMMNSYFSVGIDIVHHSINDLLCQGASPLIFMNYIAANKLAPEATIELLKGMAYACRAWGVSLIGGEMAELPRIYLKGQFDLAGCITGIAENSEMVCRDRIVDGDEVIGLASSGLHTNGYSLARKVLFDMYKLPLNYCEPSWIAQSLGQELLTPHRCYLKIIRPLIREKVLKGIAHITGGGLTENLSRILPQEHRIIIKQDTWDVLPIFRFIGTLGLISQKEMYRTFNMGIGLAIIVAPEEVSRILEQLNSTGIKAWRIGGVDRLGKGVEFL